MHFFFFLIRNYLSIWEGKGASDTRFYMIFIKWHFSMKGWGDKFMENIFTIQNCLSIETGKITSETKFYMVFIARNFSKKRLGAEFMCSI